MANPIEFWFDFSSPYAYLASEQIEALASAHGREIRWHAFMLGPVFKATGSGPLTLRYPALAKYSTHDFARSARFSGVQFHLPDPFPIMTQNTARALLYLQSDAPQFATPFLHAAFRGLFVDNQPINDLNWLKGTIDRLGGDGAVAAAACADERYKEALKVQTEHAIANGIFGAPWIVVDGEAFWGNDRLPQIARWLAQPF